MLFAVMEAMFEHAALFAAIAPVIYVENWAMEPPHATAIKAMAERRRAVKLGLRRFKRAMREK